MQHHGASLRRLTGDDVLVAALQTDPEAAPLSARSRAFVQYALKLTRTPDGMHAGDLEPLRQAGLSDAGIHDLNGVVSYYNYVNRVADGLGVELER